MGDPSQALLGSLWAGSIFMRIIFVLVDSWFILPGLHFTSSDDVICYVFTDLVDLLQLQGDSQFLHQLQGDLREQFLRNRNVYIRICCWFILRYFFVYALWIWLIWLDSKCSFHWWWLTALGLCYTQQLRKWWTKWIRVTSSIWSFPLISMNLYQCSLVLTLVIVHLSITKDEP